MRKNYKNLFISGFFGALSVITYAQKKETMVGIFGKTIEIKKPSGESSTFLKCGSTEYETYLKEFNSKRATTQQFESWLAPKIEKYKQNELNNTNTSVNQVITIPVVVHVIHNNKPYGTQENITDEQVISQITVLNQDYRRMVNTPGYNENTVGADVEIEFCLAQRTPENEPTNGINRLSIAPPSSGWFMDSVDEILKPATIWDPEQYLNIWVVDEMNLFGFIELAGYAQFPTNSGLPGIDDLDEEIPVEANTDGVVVAHGYFGSAAIYPQGNYNDNSVRGRTLTHEVGHWLGLRHIWGDSNICSEDDFCDDTPEATSENTVCTPNFSCGGQNMIENYMDYTPDTCTNTFTQDQKYRMRTVMMNATRRASLLTSQACTPPEQHGFDAGINIIALNNSNCSDTIIPEIKLSNFGTEQNITSVELTYSFANETLDYTWEGNLEPNEFTTILLDETPVISGNHQFNISITNINGQTADDFATNNSRSANFTISNIYTSNQISVNITTDEYGDETVWVLTNQEGEIVQQGGPYGANQTVSVPLNYTGNSCYTFTIYDLYGDGMCCLYGNGSYSLVTGDGEIIVEGGTFGLSESTSFITGTLSNENFEYLNNIVLYPNPVKNVLHIGVNQTSILPETVEVYNMLGQSITNKLISSNSDLTIDTSSYQNGVYFVKIVKENQVKTLKFIKN